MQRLRGRRRDNRRLGQDLRGQQIVLADDVGEVARRNHHHRQRALDRALEGVHAFVTGERMLPGLLEERVPRGPVAVNRTHPSFAPVLPDDRGDWPAGGRTEAGRHRVEVGVGGAVVDAAGRRQNRALRRKEREEIELALAEQLAEHVGAGDLGREHRGTGLEILPGDERAAGHTRRVNHTVDRAEARVGCIDSPPASRRRSIRPRQWRGFLRQRPRWPRRPGWCEPSGHRAGRPRETRSIPGAEAQAVRPTSTSRAAADWASSRAISRATPPRPPVIR